MAARKRTSLLLALLVAGLVVLSIGLWRFGAFEKKPVPASAAAEALGPTQAAASAPARKQRKGGLDVTFFVASDTHLGFDTPDRSGPEILKDPIGIEKTNLAMIGAMNSLPGRAYPIAIGGRVGTPRGVLISGDLTEDGGETDWLMFEALYGKNGTEGPLKFPVFEGAGNHDLNRNWIVRDRIRERHGGRIYSFDFDDLHLVCLDEAPDQEGLTFLEKDLNKLELDVPVILYFHFPLQGPYSSDNWFGKGDYKERLFALINERNVVGIFHGHYHASGAYRFRGVDVYNVGSPKNSYHSFAAVHVTDTQLSVASFNYDLDDFWWWHKKPLFDAKLDEPFKEIIGVRPGSVRGVKPEVALQN